MLNTCKVFLFGLTVIFCKYLIGVAIMAYYKIKDKSEENSAIGSKAHIVVPVYSDKDYRDLIVQPRTIWAMKRPNNKKKPIDF